MFYLLIAGISNRLLRRNYKPLLACKIDLLRRQRRLSTSNSSRDVARSNKWSKKFDKRPHRHLVTLAAANGFIWPQPHLIHVSLGSQESDPKRHLDRFSRFLRTPQQRLPMLFNGVDNPQKLPLPLGRTGPHVIHGSTGLPGSASQTASRSVQPFLQGSRTWPTNIQTDNTIYSVRSMRGGLKR